MDLINLAWQLGYAYDSDSDSERVRINKINSQNK